MNEMRDHYAKQNNPDLLKYVAFSQLQNLNLIYMSGGK